MTGPEDVVVTDCYRCQSLVESRTQIVNGSGPVASPLILVGEAPGEQEDQEGMPFVGRSGDILTEILRDAGIDRSAVRITNCVRCRPAGNRDPTVTEVQNCHEYLVREIALCAPKLIITLGKVPSETLLGRDVAVTQEIGTVVPCEIGDEEFQVMIGAHPAGTIYHPDLRGALADAFRQASGMIDASDQRTLSDY